MKNLKYLVCIVIICILVLIGFEFFKKDDSNKNTSNTKVENTLSNQTKNEVQTNTSSDKDNSTSTQNTNTTNTTSNSSSDSDNKTQEASREEILNEPDKELEATGWAGASNNVIILKNNILYHYDKSSKELTKIASGVNDLYYENDLSEMMTVEKNSNFEEYETDYDYIQYK